MKPDRVFLLMKDKDQFCRYELAKLLGISANALSQYFTGASTAMSDLVACNCGRYFGIPPELMVFDQQQMRAKKEIVWNLYDGLIASHPQREQLYRLRRAIDPEQTDLLQSVG